jgi:hypothetical protein
LRILAEGRFYEQTPAAFSGATLLGGGLAPEFIASPRLKFPLVFKFFGGGFKDGPNITGLEIGAGLVFNF